MTNVNKLLWREPKDDLGWYIVNPETEYELMQHVKAEIFNRFIKTFARYEGRELVPEDFILHLHRRQDSPLFLTKGAFGELVGTYKQLSKYSDHYVLTERLTCPRCGEAPSEQLIMMARLMYTDFGKKPKEHDDGIDFGL